MSQKDMIALVLAVALASVLVRLLVAHPAFGEQINKVSAQLF
jgi:hypothetical protein